VIVLSVREDFADVQFLPVVVDVGNCAELVCGESTSSTSPHSLPCWSSWILYLQFRAPALMLFLLNRMASPKEKLEQRNRTRVTNFSVQ